jgi:hypothetical protein
VDKGAVWFFAAITDWLASVGIEELRLLSISCFVQKKIGAFTLHLTLGISDCHLTLDKGVLLVRRVRNEQVYRSRQH